jgi:hypothetical protein
MIGKVSADCLQVIHQVGAPPSFSMPAHFALDPPVAQKTDKSTIGNNRFPGRDFRVPIGRGCS